jgi:GNAT superfamily N-acetyltransferase
MSVRPARPEEADLLTAVALRSKAHWGYDAEFMRACIPALTVTAERLEAEPFFVLEECGAIVGFGALHSEGMHSELTNLFVEPKAIGRGYGRQLWRYAIELARTLGARQILIASDPFAESFYRAMGAERIGETPSDAIPGRFIPLLAYALQDITETRLAGA